MNVVYYICFFVLGLVFGSFFHVVGTRLAKDESIHFPGSHCDICKHPLKARDLVPVLSYLFQKGRCRYCHEKLSPTYPIVELATGILFTISYYSFGFSLDLFVALGVVSLFIIVMVSDLTYLIIPDPVVIFFAIYFLLLQAIKGDWWEFLISLGSGVLLFVVMYMLMCLGNHLFQKESLGGGDIKLMFVVGVVLGPLLGLCNIFLGSILALPVSIFLYLHKKENVIPFGPFLLLGFLLLYFSKIDLNTIETLLNL